MKRKQHFVKLLALLLLLMPLVSRAQTVGPKHEFRGVWVQTVYQMQYQTMKREQMQAYFIKMLDKFEQLGINAFIFQVRPEADAFYRSELEPWSRFLTGAQGRAPSPMWDPMQFLIDECHKRGIEFHAWLNPYRVTSSANQQLSDDHIYHNHPEWFVSYGGKIYFNPGLPQSRKHFCSVIRDIVARYDIDGIHMDDYFYPYPSGNEPFPDDHAFDLYGERQGFTRSQKADWRRFNTDKLVEQIFVTIKKEKPWVRFGISPFGIYRNQRNTPDGSGSRTNGLQNYDDLFADILKWDREGWIDYCMPQLYWEIGHPAADYEELIYWWNRNIKNSHLYIGQDVNRSVKAPDLVDSQKNQFEEKIRLSRKLSQVKGNCFWYGTDIMANNGGIQRQMKRAQQNRALVPPYRGLYNSHPNEVKSLKTKWTPQGYLLTWKIKPQKNPFDHEMRYAIYRFRKGEKISIENPDALVATTTNEFYQLPYDRGKEKYTYVVSSINRANIESRKGKKKAVKI